MPADRRAPAGVEISSPANARVKRLVALRRRRNREQAGLTLVDGYEEIDLALTAGARPHALYRCPELAGHDPLEVAGRAAAAGAEMVTLSRAAFARIAYRESPDGWLAEVPSVRPDLSGLDLGPGPLVLVCEGVEKPGNLGAILRTADAAGVAAVIAADPVTDWGNPNLVRASKATVFSVPVASASTAQVLAWLADRGLRLVAATPSATVLATDADLTGPVALAVGAESQGLSPAMLMAAATAVRIPMFGQANSLNVATSAAILTYEAVRQRMRRGPAALHPGRSSR